MELPFFSFITIFVFLAFSLALVKERKRSKRLKLPPSPWKLPFIGHMHHLVGIPPHHALRKLSQKHGDLMHLRMGEISTIVISSPRLARDVMKTHDLAFCSRPEFLASKIFMYENSDIGCSPYGDYWRQIRKICTLELLSAKRVRSFASIRQHEVLHLIKSIQAHSHVGEPINLTEKMSSYTSSVVSRAAFGKVSKDDQKAFLQLMKEFLPFATDFDFVDMFPSLKILHPLLSIKARMVKIHHKIDRMLARIIDQHIEELQRTKMASGESGQEDLIDVLLRVKDSGDLEFPITNNNIKAVMIDMFTGGSETSSTTVEWAMSELIRNPHVMAKAQSEVRSAFRGKKTIEETDVQELKYLKLVIKETLRLHPPLPLLLPRECRVEYRIDGYVVPVKTRVLVNIWAIGRDPQYWDDPESFKPERFKNDTVDFTGTHFEYLPFGAGRRICPGMSFGLVNVELPLAHLLYHFEWTLPNDLNFKDLDMREIVGITVSRKTALSLMATSYDPSLE